MRAFSRLRSVCADVLTLEKSSGRMALAAALTLPVWAALAYALTRTPCALSECVAVLHNLDTIPPGKLVLGDGVYFRFLYWSIATVVWRTAGSPDYALSIFTLLHVATLVYLAWLFFRLCRPTDGPRVAAFTLASAALMGPSAFRANLESLPLNPTLMIMALAIGALSLLESPPSRWSGLWAVALAIGAILLKEQGLAVAAMLVVGSCAGYRGVSRKAGMLVAVLTAVYLAGRLSAPVAFPVFMRSVGLGFSEVEQADLAARFGDFPYPIYAYNVAATALNVLLAEPSRGIFHISRSIIEGRATFWHWNELGGSLLTTLLLGAWAVASWPRRHEAEGGAALRLLAVFFFGAFVPSALLGYNYTRDRFAGVPVAVEAVCVFHAARWAIAAATRTRRLATVPAMIVLVVLSASWQLRAIGTVQYQRRMAWENRKEWMVDYFDRLQTEPRTRGDSYVRLMTALYKQGTDPTVPVTERDPQWVERFLGGPW